MCLVQISLQTFPRGIAKDKAGLATLYMGNTSWGMETSHAVERSSPVHLQR